MRIGVESKREMRTEIFRGPMHSLKAYLKYLRRTQGIRVLNIERVKPDTWRLSEKGVNDLREIKKNSSEIIRVHRTNFKGYDLIDIRVFYQDAAGEWKPSPKGISFSDALLDEVIIGLSELKGAKV